MIVVLVGSVFVFCIECHASSTRVTFNLHQVEHGHGIEDPVGFTTRNKFVIPEGAGQPIHRMLEWRQIIHLTCQQISNLLTVCLISLYDYCHCATCMNVVLLHTTTEGTEVAVSPTHKHNGSLANKIKICLKGPISN